jgi:hypothetical protein
MGWTLILRTSTTRWSHSTWVREWTSAERMNRTTKATYSLKSTTDAFRTEVIATSRLWSRARCRQSPPCASTSTKTWCDVSKII